MLKVQLKPGLKGGQWAYLRPLCGHDEVFIQGKGLHEATQLLDRLLVANPETTLRAGQASNLAVCDCDRLFAELYLTYFGEQVESTVACQNCAQPFELRFSLRKLIAALNRSTITQATGPDEEGIYSLADGRRFRLPTVRDHDDLIGLSPTQALATLLKRCVVTGDPISDSESLQSAMDEVGAVLDLDLDALCPHCEASQTVQFDIQTYVLRAIAFEQRFLNREVHRIAMAYGWGYQEILNLSREDRRTFVRLIEADGRMQRRGRI